MSRIEQTSLLLSVIVSLIVSTLKPLATYRIIPVPYVQKVQGGGRLGQMLKRTDLSQTWS